MRWGRLGYVWTSELCVDIDLMDRGLESGLSNLSQASERVFTKKGDV